jgi:uncharacterized protein YndB with AHSA1/START domain
MNHNAISAKAEMLIRRPVAEVFEAFVDPERTSKFWFTSGSGRLEPGTRVRWNWAMYDVSVDVDVKAIDDNRRILIEWSGYDTPTTVEWLFTPHSHESTFASVTNAGFSGDQLKIANEAITATEGFTLVLAGLKAFLEHDVQLNLVADRHPARRPGYLSCASSAA